MYPHPIAGESLLCELRVMDIDSWSAIEARVNRVRIHGWMNLPLDALRASRYFHSVRFMSGVSTLLAGPAKTGPAFAFGIAILANTCN